MRGTDGTAGEQRAIETRHFDLAGLSAGLMDAVIERHVAALERIDRHGAREHRRRPEIFGAEQSRERQRRGNLRAIDERQAFLRAQPDGRKPRPSKPFGGRQLLTLNAHITHTQQHGAQMCQRGEIARCTHRALARHDGINLARQQRLQRLDDGEADARVAARQ